jgi:hypothetical protein
VPCCCETRARSQQRLRRQVRAWEINEMSSLWAALIASDSRSPPHTHTRPRLLAELFISAPSSLGRNLSSAGGQVEGPSVRPAIFHPAVYYFPVKRSAELI